MSGCSNFSFSVRVFSVQFKGVQVNLSCSDVWLSSGSTVSWRFILSTPLIFETSCSWVTFEIWKKSSENSITITPLELMDAILIEGILNSSRIFFKATSSRAPFPLKVDAGSFLSSVPDCAKSIVLVLVPRMLLVISKVSFSAFGQKSPEMMDF